MNSAWRWIAFWAGVFASPGAWATPYDAYGAGARGAAMAAQTATAQGAEALHYNASQLATAHTGVTVGAIATFGRAQILLSERPAGYDIPDIGPPARSIGDELVLRERSDSAIESPLAGLRIGVVAPVIFEGLQAGVLVFLPLPTPVTLRTRFADERERIFSNQLDFERVGPSVHHLDLEFGVAYEVTTWLSVGIGASYLPGFGVDTGVYLPDATNQANADLNADIETHNGFGLLAGFTVRLPGDLAVGLSFRDAVALRVSTVNEIQINGVTDGEPIAQEASWTPIYSPARLGLGVAWSPGNWTLSGDARYTFWSSYEDAQGARAGFRNVVSGALGAEYRVSPKTALRVGGAFEPSPVPPQTGRTNYVDNHRLTASLGAGHDFAVGETEFGVAWYLRVQGLLSRQTVKEQLDEYPDCAPGVAALCDELPDDLVDPRTARPFPEAQGLQTGNPGFPGWVSGGWLGSLGVELTY